MQGMAGFQIFVIENKHALIFNESDYDIVFPEYGLSVYVVKSNVDIDFHESWVSNYSNGIK